MNIQRTKMTKVMGRKGEFGGWPRSESVGPSLCLCKGEYDAADRVGSNRFP